MPRPPVKSKLVRFRSFEKELSTWKKLARAEAVTLSTWIRDNLNERAAAKIAARSPGEV